MSRKGTKAICFATIIICAWVRLFIPKTPSNNNAFGIRV